jgi:hypothetical protein
MYDKLIPIIVLNREKKKPFTLNSGMRQRCPHSPLLLNIVPKIFAREKRKEKEIRRIQIGKKTVKLFLFAAGIILYLKDFSENS